MTSSNVSPTMTADTLAIVKKMAGISREVNARYLESSDRVEALLAALIGKQHVVLLGPAGEGKTGVINALLGHISDFGDSYFEQMVDHRSTPDHLFGALDPKGFQAGYYRYLTKGMLSEAKVAFIDECFKASTFLLNSWLSLMNERKFSNYGAIDRSPLITLVGASNEMPNFQEAEDAGQNIGALWDRFTLRLQVKPLSRAAARQAWDAEWERRQQRAQGVDTSGAAGTSITLAELARLQEAALTVKRTELVKDLFWQLLDKLYDEHGVAEPSTRRRGWLTDLISASAVLAGRTETAPEDLLILRHALWQDIEEIPAVRGVVFEVAQPELAKAQRDYDAILADYATMKAEARTLSETQRDAARGKMNGNLKNADVNMRRAFDTALRAGNVTSARALQAMGKDISALRQELLNATMTETNWDA